MRSFKNIPFLPFFKKISKYFFELLVVIFGVYLGFMANNYSDELKQKQYSKATIKEMYISLEHDIKDADLNREGHYKGIESLKFFFRIVKGSEVDLDSFDQHLINITRSFISVQNTASFEALKSNGLSLIVNDTLRTKIIKLYDFQYDMLEKIEESYAESQLFKHFYPDLMNIIDKSLYYNDNLKLEKISRPLEISNEERSRLILLLKRLWNTRYFNISVYDEVIGDMQDLRTSLENVYPNIKM